MSDDFQLPLISHDERKAEYKLIPLEELTPNDQMASGEMSAKDFSDVRDHGIIVPIVVVPNEGDWKYEVKDGRRRLRAARRLLAAGLTQFSSIPALVYTVYDEDDAVVWPSSINARRSRNVLTDLQVLMDLLDRYPDVDVNTKEGLRFLAQRMGLAPSTIKKMRPMLDMPAKFIKAANENVSSSSARKKIPQGSIEMIASLGQSGWDRLSEKLTTNGFVTWDDVSEERKSLTAGKVAEMQTLPGFDDLPAVDFSVCVGVPLLSLTETEIILSDVEGVISTWTMKEWMADPQIVFSIIEALRLAYEDGTYALRDSMNISEVDDGKSIS